MLDKLDEEEIAKMDADEIMARQVEELEKEKKELQVDLHKGIVYEIFNVLLLISQGGGTISCDLSIRVKPGMANQGM